MYGPGPCGPTKKGPQSQKAVAAKAFWAPEKSRCSLLNTKKKKKKMPIAGNKSADRARAHLRWAERYSKYGDVHKATSHFGRAMEYSANSFGTEHTFAIRGADGSSRNLRIEVTVGSENTNVHVSDWSGNEDATRFTNDVMLTIAEPSEYFNVNIETQDIEQLQKHLNRTGYTEGRVVFCR